jgi:hypothetical protein
MPNVDLAAAGRGERETPPWRASCKQRRRLSSLSTILEVLPGHGAVRYPLDNLEQAESFKSAWCQDGQALSLANSHQHRRQQRERAFAGLLDQGIRISSQLPSPAASRPASPSPTHCKSRRRNSSSRFSVSSISGSIAASLSALAMATPFPSSSSSSASLHHVHHSPTSPHRSIPLKSAMRSPRSSTVSLDAVTEGISSLGGAAGQDTDSLSSASGQPQPQLSHSSLATAASTSTSAMSSSSTRRRSSHGAYVSRVSFDDTDTSGGGGGTGFDQSYTLRATTSGFVRTRESRTFLVATDLNAYSMHALNWCIDSLIEGEQRNPLNKLGIQVAEFDFLLQTATSSLCCAYSTHQPRQSLSAVPPSRK